MKTKNLLLLLPIMFISTAAFAADGGFLFVTFKGEQSPMTEQIYFGLSRDGRHWEALNDAEPVLISKLGEQGMRDPYILRSHDGAKFFIVATDLSIHLNPNWRRAVQAGSRSIVIWESDDLVTWSEPRLVEVAPPEAGCTWAPEAIYDPASGRYLVFWASTSRQDDFAKHRIWGAWTDDFRTFGEPFIYIEKPTAVIDTTIVRDEGKYYRFTKDEKFKAITMEVSDSVTGQWREIPEFSLAKLTGYEGPQCYLVEAAAAGQPPTWCLILDHYSRSGGYQSFVSHDLSSGQFVASEGFSLPFRFRHGSVLPVSAAEYARLEAAFGKREAEGPAR